MKNGLAPSNSPQFSQKTHCGKTAVLEFADSELVLVYL